MNLFQILMIFYLYIFVSDFYNEFFKVIRLIEEMYFMESVLLYSEIIPTVIAVAGLYFILMGGLGEEKIQLIIGIVLFVLAVAFPFISLSILI